MKNPNRFRSLNDPWTKRVIIGSIVCIALSLHPIATPQSTSLRITYILYHIFRRLSIGFLKVFLFFQKTFLTFFDFQCLFGYYAYKVHKTAIFRQKNSAIKKKTDFSFFVQYVTFPFFWQKLMTKSELL